MASVSSALAGSKATRPRSLWGRRLGIFLGGWETRVSGLFLLILVVIALVPTDVWPRDAFGISLLLRLNPPSLYSGHLLGTDALGRDMLYRILAGTKLTLLISGLATAFATITGTAAGLVAGYFRGWVDMVISRLVDLMLAFPILLLILALVAAFGQSMTSLIVVLGLSGWAGYARVIRSSTLTLAESEFVEAARCAGSRSGPIVVRHLLPNVASPVLVLATLNLASFILVESAVSFLGLGVQPPDVTWGSLIGDGRQNMYEAWWVTFFPGLAIILTVLAFNLIGDAMRDAFDPYARA